MQMIHKLAIAKALFPNRQCSLNFYISANGNVYMKLFHISPVPETGCPKMGHTGLTIDHWKVGKTDSSDRSFDFHIGLHAHLKDGRLNLFPGIP